MAMDLDTDGNATQAGCSEGQALDAVGSDAPWQDRLERDHMGCAENARLGALVDQARARGVPPVRLAVRHEHRLGYGEATQRLVAVAHPTP